MNSAAAPNMASPAPWSALVIDDEPGVRLFTRIVLEGDGFVVAEAEDTATSRARIAAAAVAFNLIVLDASLPDASGSGLLPELRRLTPASRVLVVSGVPEEEVAVTGDGFLGKPYNQAALLGAVQRVLGDREA